MEEYTEEPSTKQIVIKWGLILALISIALALTTYITQTVGGGLNWVGGVVTIIVIVLAHREYKSQGDGYMTFGKGLGIGTLVSVVSSVVSTIFSYIYLKFVDLAYMDIVREEQIREMEKTGMSDAEIDQALEFTSFFSTPEFILIIGIFGGVLIGFILSLIISAFTKNNDPSLEV